ncbi:phosphate-binding protein PstS [Rhodospirillales bacterium TMPK1]|uniref:Phosphate-binding protein PstS n=2 Tax=Roseiterribacter gracilis TaxID=2812848 RepID=A0A8S8XK35_9PROT|nr:phosphate-binding protein PstS [Rhodospirillales bacterium TMPK1]
MLLAVSLFAAPAASAQQKLVDWPQLPVARSVPQTDAEKEFGKEHGRKLPTPEILQPTLDPALQPYQAQKGVKLTGTRKAAASDVLPDLVHRWVDGFRKHHPGVQIDLSPPYAGSLGAKELVNGKLDIVFVSRELKPDDITEFKAKFGYEPSSVPVSGGTYRHYGFLDALGFFVHKDNPLESITFDQLDALLSTTRHRGGAAITNWGQLGLTGDWADKPIHVYGVKPWNGFEEFVRQRVLSVGAKRGEWRTDINFAPVVFPLASNVAADRLGIGYAGLAYIDAPVKMLALCPDAKGLCSAPSYENVARADYPLSRLVFLNFNHAPDKKLDPIVAELLRYIHSRDGQQAVLAQGIYLPLRAKQIP